MVNAAVKTPNKRKSIANATPESGTSPKKPKPNDTPGKNQNKTPAKGQTPKLNNKTPGKTPAKTPKGNATPGKTPGKANQGQGPKPNASPKGPKPNQTPGKGPLKAVKAPQQNIVRVKKESESGNEDSTKKVLKIKGTGQLKASGEEKLKRKGQFFHILEKIKGNDGAEAVAEIEGRIKAIKGRKELSKTAKRKLRLLQKMQRVATGAPAPANLNKAEKKKVKKADAKIAGNGVPVKGAKAAPKAKKVAAKPAKKPQVVQEVEEDDGDSSESDYDVESSIKPDKIIKTENEEEDESDEEDDDDDSDLGDEEEDEDDSDDEEEVGVTVKSAKPALNKGKKPQAAPKGVNLDDLKKNDIVAKGQKRYVLFVGNLPYDVTKKEIIDHFQKVGNIRDVRIPSDSKTDKPRGFAYVEVENEESYQRALSMHHTFINKRRINVLYSQGGKKKGEEKKGEIKAKNFKLHAMRQQGQLAGSVKQNQKRGVRRGKAANAKVVTNGS